jgi:8-oxo-dGTP pyrophosphatase MutT (NUDIX family)
MVYCFNCKKQGHGFAICKKLYNFCTKCQTNGHHEDQCEFFNKLCYRCTKDGNMTTYCHKHGKLKRCGAIIIDDKRNILLVQGHSGVWSLPKGHQSYIKEPYTICAMREVYEETGLKLKITKNFKQVEIGNIVYYLIELNDYYKRFLKIRDKDEVKKIDWVHMKSIMNLDNINWSLKQVGKYFKDLI